MKWKIIIGLFVATGTLSLSCMESEDTETKQVPIKPFPHHTPILIKEKYVEADGTHWELVKHVGGRIFIKFKHDKRVIGYAKTIYCKENTSAHIRSVYIIKDYADLLSNLLAATCAELETKHKIFTIYALVQPINQQAKTPIEQNNHFNEVKKTYIELGFNPEEFDSQSQLKHFCFMKRDTSIKPLLLGLANTLEQENETPFSNPSQHPPLFRKLSDTEEEALQKIMELFNSLP